jgi:hypothetical protein
MVDQQRLMRFTTGVEISLCANESLVRSTDGGCAARQHRSEASGAGSASMGAKEIGI